MKRVLRPKGAGRWANRPIVVSGSAVDDQITVSDSHVHRIDDFLHEEWIDAWASEVLGQVEDYLAKHAAFDAFLEDGSGAAGAV